MIKIFLIALFSNEKFPFIGESHGICAISGYLNEKYFGIVETYLFDQQINSNEEILSEIKSKRPEIIGFSVKMQTLNNWDTFYNLIKNNISSYNPLVILGNSTAHFNSDYLLNNYDNILISFGEGEVSFGDLIKYVKGKIPVDKIRNIGYRKKGKIICTDREYLPTIEIPIADRRYSDLYYTKGGEVYIEGSRGCAYCCCSICECRLFLGSHQAINKWRPKPVSKILNELSELEILGIKEVTFSDEDFIGDDILGASHALQIAEELIDKQIRIQYRINARVHSIFRLKDNIVNRNNKIQLLKQLKKSGLVKIFLGFESGSESQLKRYNKGFKLLEFLNAKKILDELSIEYELGYISLDPLMTLEELKEIFPSSKYITLTKTYRSSKEIIEYTNKILNLTFVSAIRKDNSIPVTKHQKDDLLDLIPKLRSKYKSLAIITKDRLMAENLYKKLESIYDLSLLTIDSKNFRKDFVIAPSYLAKGLEFDSVIVYNNLDNPFKEVDKYLYYIACTRCQHELHLYYL